MLQNWVDAGFSSLWGLAIPAFFVLVAMLPGSKQTEE